MNLAKYTGIIWSDVELAGLLEDEDSHVSFERFKKHVGLHPFQLTNLKYALNEILCSMLNIYDRDLKGFIIAYKNPKLLTPLGEILHDSCFIHIDIQVDFYIFRPKIGISLKGIVNKIVSKHIGIVVLKAFAIIVLRPTDDNNWVGNHVQMWQEVRVTLTVLNHGTKVLSYIGGIFDPHNYLQGCRLPTTYFNTNCISFDNNMAGNTDRTSKKDYILSKHMLFQNDIENFSEENMSPARKKSGKHKKLNKSLKQEVVKYSKKEKKDKRGSEILKEVVELESPKYISNIRMNDKFTDNEELEEFITSKSTFEKKSRRYSSQNCINEDVNEECEKYLSKEISKRLSGTELNDKLNKIELNIEETILENEVKLTKNSRKRKYSKSFNDSEEIRTDIKMEKFDDTYQEKNKIEKSSKKKRNMDLKASESEVNRHSKTVLLKEKCRNYKIQNTKIKTEKLISSSENAQNEDYTKAIKVPMDTGLGMFTHSVSCDLVEDGESDMKKKQKKHSKTKIKIEPEFEEIVTKIERPDNEDEDIYQEDLWNSSEINSPKQKHKTHLDNSIENDDTNNRTKYFNKTNITVKGTKSHNIKVEADSCVINSESNHDDQNIYTNDNKAKLKHERVTSNSDFNFNNVKIRTKKFLNNY